MNELAAAVVEHAQLGRILRDRESATRRLQLTKVRALLPQLVIMVMGSFEDEILARFSRDWTGT